MTTDATLSIGQVAERAGIETSAVRYYESLGLLPRPARVGGKRRFTADVLDRLALVALAKEAGFSMREIRQLVGDYAPGSPPAERWKKLATRKLEELDAAAERIHRMRRVLKVALASGCLSLQDCAHLLRAGAR